MEENKTQINNQGKLKTVKTYMSDMADTVRANEISVIKVALAEQNKHEREDLYRQAEGTPTKKIFFVIGGLILIAAGVYGSYYFVKQKKVNNAPEIIAREGAIISYDEIYSLTLKNGDDLVSKINSAKKESSNTGIKNGFIKYFSLDKDTNGIKEKFGVKELFSKFYFTAPPSLVRSLADSYMVGTYTKKLSGSVEEKDGQPKLFIILQSKDYEFTYAGMLEWEKTISSDMFNLFEFDTSENKLEMSNRKWKDIIMSNKDARVLFNEKDRPILYYIFADKNNIIIADSVDTIKEIISRLLIKNIKPL